MGDGGASDYPRGLARRLQAASFLLGVAGVLAWEGARGFAPWKSVRWPSAQAIKNGAAAREIDRVLDRHGVLAATVRPLYQELLYVALREVNRRLTLGEDRWFFLAGTTRRMPRWEVEARARGMAPWVRDAVRWFERRGTWVFVTIVPNKATMHPEKLPRARRPAPPTYPALLRCLRAEGVRVVDLRPALSSVHGDSWLPCEAHWTSQGARRAADVVAAAVKAAWPGTVLPGQPVRGVVQPQRPRGIRGDLLKMLGFRPWGPVERPLIMQVDPLLGVDAETGALLEGGKHSVVLVGTSFANSRRFGSLLAVALGRRVEERTAAGLGPGAGLPPLVDEIRAGTHVAPSILIWEIPERHALDEALAGRLAAMLGRGGPIAPVRPGVDLASD